MKRLLGILFLLLAVSLPALSQDRPHLSDKDQGRFDSYFSRWLDYRSRNDGDQIRSMEGRMQSIYRDYGIPADLPYERVASNFRYRDWKRPQLSDKDQGRFDSYYSRWLDYRRRNDGDQVRSMEGRMQDLYRRYNIPPDVPYRRIAGRARPDWDDDDGRWDERRDDRR